MKKITCVSLFEELAKPDENGCSRWVRRDEFVGRYERLYTRNGWSWGRAGSAFDRKYKFEVERSNAIGNPIVAIRTVGWNTDETFANNIRADIKKALMSRKCVMLGVNGSSVNTRIEIDHKDGRKTDMRVSDPETQQIDDFQPLCKAANDVKRQICKECRSTNKRWDATNIPGNPYPFYAGNEDYDEELKCVGCYQYDPVAYRRECARRIACEASSHTADFIMEKLYGKD